MITNCTLYLPSCSAGPGRYKDIPAAAGWGLSACWFCRPMTAGRGSAPA